MESFSNRGNKMIKEKNYIFTTIDAIESLVGGGISHPYNSSPIYHDGQTPPSEEDIKTEQDRLQAEYATQEYARNRATDYPDTGDQFNKIYDDGLTKWKSEMVDPVKTKWPKDNSGPV